MAESLNPQQAENLRNLAKLVRLLNCKRYLTITEIAERLDCTYAGVSRRLDVLEDRGCNIRAEEPKPRRGKVGAPPWRYRLVENKAARKILDAARRLA
jgi:predicted ArsR family transcriptional regulator